MAQEQKHEEVEVYGRSDHLHAEIGRGGPACNGCPVCKGYFVAIALTHIVNVVRLEM